MAAPGAASDPLSWSCAEVASWCEQSGTILRSYAMCFEDNHVDGRKLRHIDASQLVRLGIRKFDHVREGAAAIRALYGLPAPDALASVRDVPFARCWYTEAREKQGPASGLV